ncbi:MAG TPA: dicarboxylate/amino acid:cation symporter, partial [Bacteroidetes bacterium]|nr:dicarboxylate/amino acid:cation symporter [Bacteroidota bacterium]
MHMSRSGSIHKSSIIVTFILGLIIYILFTLSTASFSPTVFLIFQLIRNIFLFIFLYFLFEKAVPMELYTKILLGLIFGAAAGLIFHQSIVEFKPIGTAFIRLIQMIVMPLVLASLFIGTASLGDIRKMGRIGGKTLLFYLLYTAFAVAVGLFLANIFQPGSGLPEHIKQALMQNYSAQAGSKVSGVARPSIINTFLNIIPTNPFTALSGGILLQIIFFAIFGGAVVTMIPDR